MDLNELYQKALRFEFLTAEEGMYLFENAALVCLQTNRECWEGMIRPVLRK